MKKSPKTSPKAPEKIAPKAAVASPTAVAPVDAGTTLNDDQMQQLAQFFHDISVEIGQVRLDAIKAGAALTDPGIVQLQGYVSP
jgi:hypothetical protein